MGKFTEENTTGFTDTEIDEMNDELSRLLVSDELAGIDEDEREKEFQKQILDRF